MARPPACLKSLEKSQLKSWLHAFPSFPSLYRSLFLFCFSPSCLLFTLVTTTARFAHYFPFSFILPRLLILRAAERSSCKKTISSFSTIRRATVLALRYFFSLSFAISLSEANASKQVWYLSHITRFYKILNIIVEAIAVESAPRSELIVVLEFYFICQILIKLCC